VWHFIAKAYATNSDFEQWTVLKYKIFLKLLKKMTISSIIC